VEHGRVAFGGDFGVDDVEAGALGVAAFGLDAALVMVSGLFAAGGGAGGAGQ
jgi:hypothetical protein